MIKTTITFSILFCFISNSLHAQKPAGKTDSLVIGTWRGTSICQVKNSPCHDETVVYHIYKGSAADSFYINASKIINGAEDEMGILPCVLNRKTMQLSSTAYGTWAFNITGDKIDGTLYVRGELYRIIKLKKE
jgi:hypothetical protein